MNFYNEHDPKAAAWLRELIARGHIAPGVVDERSIEDIAPEELSNFVQCHFFSGIGGWSLALRLAGWPDDRPVWTGSCPCQPFSVAGKGKGTADERHLWPAFKWLISQCQPPVVFGEQVASKDGRQWLAGVRLDLEDVGYAVGAADLCAAGIGAPHIRQRLYWMAHARSQPEGGQLLRSSKGAGESRQRPSDQFRGSGGPDGLGLSNGAGRKPGKPAATSAGHGCATEPAGSAGRLVNADGAKEERFGPECVPLEPEQEAGRSGDADAWSEFETVGCADGKTRRIESGTFPLAHGIPGRVGLLRGYGNAIVPPLAAQFILSCEEATSAENAAS